MPESQVVIRGGEQEVVVGLDRWQTLSLRSQ
jgi:hypothetical protein